MTKVFSLNFPRSAEIKRAIAAVKKAGVVVGSVEICPTGALHIHAAGGHTENAANEFDEWEKLGKL